MSFSKKIIQSQLFKIVSLNSFSVALKIGIGLITSKFLAVFIGPSGMALVGNLRNFLTSLESISTLGFQTGIVKYVAENKKNDEELQKIIATVFISLIVIVFFLSSVLYFFADFLNAKIFGFHFDYAVIFKALSFSVPWYAVSIILLAILNGLGSFKKVIWVNIIGNVVGLIVSLTLVLQYKILGALLAAVISPSILFFVTFYFLNKEINFLNVIRVNLFDFKIIKNLSNYSLMALFSSILGPFIFLVIRNNIIENLGLQEAGFWETMTRISSYYLMFVSSVLSVYFFPKLVMSQNENETKIIFWTFYKFILPIFIFGFVIIYFFRFFIIRLLFTIEFLPVTDLFFWQLLGDVFKVSSLILGFQFFAKKMTKAFIITEVGSLAILYFLSVLLIKIFGVEGVVIAQAIDNFIYLVVLGFYFRRSLF